MNKARRKQIDDVIRKLDDLKMEIESILDDEQDYLDNIPENLQGSERYDAADEAVSYLSDASETIDEVSGMLESAKG